MSFSVAPFIVSLVLIQRLRKQARIKHLEQEGKILKFSLFFSIFLIAVEATFSLSFIFSWIWDALILCIIYFALKQQQLKVTRMFVWAFVPYIIVSLLTKLTELIRKDFYVKWENYFDIAELIVLIWMAAILFSQNRQNKMAEKEQLKRDQEDKVNKAIAMRKVELEEEVAERTAELIKQKDDLQLTLTELKATQAQLIQSEKMASLGELTAGIAHEIQNPLNFVNNFSEVSNELIKEMIEEINKGNNGEVKAIASDIVQNLEKINHHGKRADAIVKGMLQHSRTSTGQKEPVNINALADEYLRLAYHGLRAKDKSFNAALKTHYDENIGEINVIPQDIGRVILNLITNAFYAVTEKNRLQANASTGAAKYEPAVSVSTKKIPDLRHHSAAGFKVEIKVADNGNGIPEKVFDKIFQPFFTTKPTGQGTGLGLSMSYDIITKGHGGELTVTTKEGAGSEFTIILSNV